VLNATFPISTLKWKPNSIAYHRVCEAIAANVIRIAKVSGKKNLADMLTKPLPANELIYLARKVLFLPNVYELNEPPVTPLWLLWFSPQKSFPPVTFTKRVSVGFHWKCHDVVEIITLPRRIILGEWKNTGKQITV
jgi:hypothetical protein